MPTQNNTDSNPTNEGLSRAELQQLKDQLPHGSLRKISERLQLSYAWVRRVFGGDAYDARVITCAIGIRDAHLEEVARLKEQIKTPQS